MIPRYDLCHAVGPYNTKFQSGVERTSAGNAIGQYASSYKIAQQGVGTVRDFDSGQGSAHDVHALQTDVFRRGNRHHGKRQVLLDEFQVAQRDAAGVRDFDSRAGKHGSRVVGSAADQHRIGRRPAVRIAQFDGHGLRIPADIHQDRVARFHIVTVEHLAQRPHGRIRGQSGVAGGARGGSEHIPVGGDIIDKVSQIGIVNREIPVGERQPGGLDGVPHTPADGGARGRVGGRPGEGHLRGEIGTDGLVIQAAVGRHLDQHLVAHVGGPAARHPPEGLGAARHSALVEGQQHIGAVCRRPAAQRMVSIEPDIRPAAVGSRLQAPRRQGIGCIDQRRGFLILLETVAGRHVAPALAPGVQIPAGQVGEQRIGHHGVALAVHPLRPLAQTTGCPDFHAEGRRLPRGHPGEGIRIGHIIAVVITPDGIGAHVVDRMCRAAGHKDTVADINPARARSHEHSGAGGDTVADGGHGG